MSNNAVSKWIKTGKIGRENFFSLVSLLGSENAPFIGDLIESEIANLENVVQMPSTARFDDELLKLSAQMSAKERSSC